MFYTLAFLLFVFFAEVLLQQQWIKIMHSKKIEQVTKLYGPLWHEKTKLGTPTMGGVVFVAVSLLSFLLLAAFYGKVEAGAFPDRYGYFIKDSAAILSYPILAAAVGFIDEWLKYRRHSSDGLTSRQKLALQILVTLPWAVFMYKETGRAYVAPMSNPAVFVAAVTFIGVGLQNAVNVTDGLDSLAAGCSFISFLAIAPLTLLAGGEYIFAYNVMAASLCLGFLWHNCNPASVFMGDVGAHFLAGLMFSLCVYSESVFYAIPACFFFGVEIFSVAAQIIAIRRFHRKIFKMSPIHHHFEISGWKETQIVLRFWIIHFIGVLVLCSVYIVYLT